MNSVFSFGSWRTSKRRLPGSFTEASWLARVASMKASTHSGLTVTLTRVTCMSAPPRWLRRSCGRRVCRRQGARSPIKHCRMKLSDFDFHLPAEAIAQHPVEPRDAARMLVVGDTLADRSVRDLPALLAPGDLLVCNDTKVIPVRLAGRRGEVAVEATLIEDLGDGRWRAMARPGTAAQARAADRVCGRFCRRSPRQERWTARSNSPLAWEDRSCWRRWRRTGRCRCRPTSSGRGRARRATTPTTRPSSPPVRGRSRRRPPGCISLPLSSKPSMPAASAGPRSRCMSAPEPSCR